MKELHTLTLKSEYEEVEKVEGLLDTLQSELDFDNEFYARLMLTVSEAVTNGIVHGNQLDGSKSVTLSVKQDGNKLIFETADEGTGFEPSELPDPLAEENLMKPSGRGVFLMKEYADEVNYTDGGTKLRLVFNLPG